MLRRKRKLRNYKITKLQNGSRGYILITMMLFFSLLAIAALAVLPDIAFQIKRDREEELIHRGLGYSRAIRHFYKKFGRYPAKIEDLEDTNNLRFIRQRYKDPVTGGDFKILRLGDPALANLQMPGRVPGPGVQGKTGGTAASGGLQQQADQPTQVTTTGGTNPAGAESGSSPDTQNSSGSSSSSLETSSSKQQVFGGGPILGVASTNKGETIREFCKKNHYNEWLFIYDPTSDRGGALNTPWCPGLNIPGLNLGPTPPTGSPSPPNTGAPGTVSPTHAAPNPGADMPPEQ
jgi:type II secretory pathway pseudopilin PulG